MNDPEYYYEIASHAYMIGTILIEAYCLSVWGRSFMSVKAKVWRVSVAYVIAMIVLEYIPVVMSGMTAHLIGIMIAFVVMCLTDRGYVKQKFYLIIAFYSLRWLSWNIISCIANELMVVWSALYWHTTEQGIQLWIFDNYWIGQYVLQSIAELMLGFLLIYGAVRCMLRVYGNRRENMSNKEFVLLIMPAVLTVGSQGLIRYYLDVYWEHTGWNIYDNYDGYDFYMMFYVLLCYGTILATAYVYRQWKNEMKEKGIAFDCSFHYPQDENVNAFDISIILNNALSNAIEAVERERFLNMQDQDIGLTTHNRLRTIHDKLLYLCMRSSDTRNRKKSSANGKEVFRRMSV